MGELKLIYAKWKKNGASNLRFSRFLQIFKVNFLLVKVILFPHLCSSNSKSKGWFFLYRLCVASSSPLSSTQMTGNTKNMKRPEPDSNLSFIGSPMPVGEAMAKWPLRFTSSKSRKTLTIESPSGYVFGFFSIKILYLFCFFLFLILCICLVVSNTVAMKRDS